MPRSAVEKVIDLTVTEDNLATALEEAENLPSVEITKLDLQWLQVILKLSDHNMNYLSRFLVRGGLLL